MKEIFTASLPYVNAIKVFIISDKVSENISHVLRTAWFIKWANVTVLQKPE